MQLKQMKRTKAAIEKIAAFVRFFIEKITRLFITYYFYSRPIFKSVSRQPVYIISSLGK